VINSQLDDRQTDVRKIIDLNNSIVNINHILLNYLITYHMIYVYGISVNS